MGIIVHFKIEPKRNETLHQSLICSLVLNEYDHFHNSFFFLKVSVISIHVFKKGGKNERILKSIRLSITSHDKNQHYNSQRKNYFIRFKK